MLKDIEDYNRLRDIIGNAATKEVITSEEVGFIITLTERFRADIDTKLKQLYMLQGEITQLKNNEQIIINLVENMIGAAERHKANQEAMDKIKGVCEDKSKLERNKKK
jgi:hypothetical protein